VSFSYLINDVLPGFLEELRCTICKGLDPRIALFGIAAEASTRRCRACRSISLLASSTALATRNNTPYSVSSGPDWCSVFTWVFLRARSRSTPSYDEDVLAVVSESLGYQVVTAVNATQALEFLEGDQPVDVLLSDVIMPGGMNGAQLAVEARRLRPALKVLLTSGSTAAGLSREHGLPDNLNVLEKPFHREELAKTLRLVIGR